MSSSKFVVFPERSSTSFRLEHINVSFANAIRRTIISDIPTVVLDSPTILVNQTKLNNELIRQRLQAIPVHIQTLDPAVLETIEIEVNQENTGETIFYVTTEHFTISSTTSSELFGRDDVFPFNELTNQYIDVVRLLPQVSKRDVEKIHFKCKLKTATAKENANYNVVSQCIFVNTLDDKKIDSTLSEKRAEWKDQTLDEATTALKESDFQALERHRIFVPNSFDFTIKSVGVYSNQQLMQLCCAILIQRLEKLRYEIAEHPLNCFEIKLLGEDYTIGKMLEYCLHNALFENSKQLFFCGFVKAHPHDMDSMIKLTYKKERTLTDVKADVGNSIQSCVEVLKEIQKAFV